MKEGHILYILLALLAGILVTFQGGINTRLGMKLNNGDYAALVTFIIGTVALIIYLLLTKQSIPSVTLFKEANWWMYLGGLTGVAFVLIVIMVTPKLGVGSTTVLLLCAQILTSLLIDQFDIFSLGQRTIDLSKIIGVVLLVSGVLLITRK